MNPCAQCIYQVLSWRRCYGYTCSWLLQLLASPNWAFSSSIRESSLTENSKSLAGLWSESSRLGWLLSFSWIYVSILLSTPYSPSNGCIVDCRPIDANWLPNAHGNCINIPQSFWAMVLSDIISDGSVILHIQFSTSWRQNLAVILSMPAYQIYKLQMSTSRKLQIFGTFLLGAFVVLAGIIRCILAESSVSPEAAMDITCKSLLCLNTLNR